MSQQVKSPDRNADVQFFGLGVQYYVAARFAASAGLMPVAGNLYHHAIEMCLKGHLSRSMPLSELKDRLRHNLERIWTSFKLLFPNEDLSRFDQLVFELHRFERIRYPDAMLKEGMTAVITWLPVDNPEIAGEAVKDLPHYKFAVTDLDRFISGLFRICSVSPKFFSTGLAKAGRDVLLDENPESARWQ